MKPMEKCVLLILKKKSYFEPSKISDLEYRVKFGFTLVAISAEMSFSIHIIYLGKLQYLKKSYYEQHQYMCL